MLEYLHFRNVAEKVDILFIINLRYFKTLCHRPTQRGEVRATGVAKKEIGDVKVKGELSTPKLEEEK